ncbi:MAG: hypothetical protein ACRD1X_18000 [Vicinamibacteria bacterium]
MFGALGQDEPASALITPPGLAQLLSRAGYYGSLSEAFSRWAETNLPHDLRPYGIVVDSEGAHINPPEALDVLIDSVRARESPLKTLFWSTLAAATGAIVYTVVQKRMK